MVVMDLLPIPDASHRIAVGRQFAIIFKKAGWFSHVSAE
jgi:hypothetical protein